MNNNEPSILSQTEGERFSVGPFAILSRVSGTQSSDAFEMYELGLGIATIDYHIHRRMDETIYVLEGEIEFIVEGQKHLRQAGSVAFIPRGVHHGFSNPGPANARVLLVFSPNGNQHEYFRAMESLRATSDETEIKALQKRYDQELIPLGT